MNKRISRIAFVCALGIFAFVCLPTQAFFKTNDTVNSTLSPESTPSEADTTSGGKIVAVLDTFRISGNVKSDGANLMNATVTLSGSQSQIAATDANGNYSFTANAGGNYTVSVSKNGIVFNPASQSFTNLQANQTADFINGSPLCVPPSTGLIGWWKGENNANDSSSFGNHGSAIGVGYTGGKTGQAFNFDGVDDFVRIPSALTLNLTSQLSLQAWVYPTSDSSNADIVSMIINKETNTEAYQYEIARKNNIACSSGSGIPTGNFAFYLYGLAGMPNDCQGWVNSNAALPLNAWSQVALTYDGTNVRSYVNGALTRTIPTSGSIPISNGNLKIGGRSLSSTQALWAGQIDEVQLHNRALSASEIAAIYNAGSAGVCASGAIFTNTNPTGKIAFYSTRTGNDEIFTMNADGSGQTNVSNNSAADFYGEWSPDGSKIVFVSNRNNNYDIYVMNADGTNQIRLTTNTATDNTPSWSPEGNRIVFISDRDYNNYNYEIYIMNADGTNQTRLTNSSGYNSFPKFSPDGSRIAFTSYFTGNYEIYVMNADGTNVINLTNNSSYDDDSSWSSDGSKIAFFGERSGRSEIWLMNSNGTNPVNLSNNPAGDYHPSFSSDGSKIAFTSYRNNNNDIYVMNAADGTNQTRLTTDAGFDQHPSWQRMSGTVPVAPAANINLNFANVSQAGNTVATPLPQSQFPALPIGYSLISPIQSYDIRTSAQYSGNVTVTFSVPNIPHSQMCDRLRLLHFENGNWATNNNSTPVYNIGTKICTVQQTVSSLSPFVVAQTSAPTATSVSVGGRVLTAEGRGIRNVRVSLTNSAGETRTVMTGTFGYYRFADIQVGETYVISIAAKRFVFAPPVQTLNLQEEQNDINFTAHN